MATKDLIPGPLTLLLQQLSTAFDVLDAGPSFFTAGAVWTPSDVLTDEAAGKHLNFGYDSANSIGYIRSVNSGTAFTDLRLAGLKTSLWSATGAGDVVETLTASGGNVGIGTAIPAVALDVGNQGEIRSTGGAVQTFIQSSSGNGGYIGTRSNDFLQFRTNNLDRLRILASGFVGIGTVSPSVLVHALAATDDAIVKIQTGIAGKDAQFILDRFVDTERAIIVHQTGSATTWAVGLLKNGGVATNTYGIGTTANLSSAKLTIDTAGLVTVAGSLAIAGLTSGRVPVVGASGLLGDDADLTFSVDTLTSTKFAATTSLTTPLILSAANLAIDPVGDVVFNAGGKDILPSVNYDQNLGALSKKYLALHAAELWVETLVAQDTAATIGGRILVGPTTVLTSDLAAAATSIIVKHNQMASGDRVYMEANGKVEFMAITSAPSGGGPYTYTVTRDLDGTGANDWFAGDAVFNTGTTGDGFIDLYSLRGVKSSSQIGPTIVGNVRNGATYNDWSEAWAIGNLNGLYGYGADTYGVGLGKFAASASHLTIDSTNGIRIFKDTATVIGQWSAAGVITVGQVAASESNILISSGALQIRNNTSVIGEWAANGNITLGFVAASFDNILISASGTISIRNNTTNRIHMTAAGVLSLNDSAGAAKITLDASAGMTLDGKMQMLGAASAIAIGTTPPTSAALGTGLWLDRTGMYGLASDVVQAKFDAATGQITAGAGSTILNASGVTLLSGTAYAAASSYKHKVGANTIADYFASEVESPLFTINATMRTNAIAGYDTSTAIQALAASGQISTVFIETRVNGVQQSFETLTNTAVTVGFAGSTVTSVTSSGLAVTGNTTVTGNLAVIGTAPLFVMQDTTASAKYPHFIVDANVLQIREQAGASGSLLVLDLANNRVGVGRTPSTAFDCAGEFRCTDGAVVMFMVASAGGGSGYFGSRSNHGFRIRSNDTDRIIITALGSVILGNEAALATTATDGFVYLPTCAGTPTGTPTASTGKVAAVYDTTANKFWIYNGAWRGVVLA